MNSGVFEHVGRLEFNDFFPEHISVDKSAFNCYLLQGNMDKVLKEVIQTGSEYISDDIGSNSVMTEVSFESVIRSLKIGTGCYNSVLSLDLSVYSELESVEIGDFSFRSCVRFKCSGLKNLQRLVIGNGCFSRIEWYGNESYDGYDEYDSESDIDEENEYDFDDSEEYGIDFDDVELLNGQYETDEDSSASDAALLSDHDHDANHSISTEYTENSDEDEYIDSNESEYSTDDNDDRNDNGDGDEYVDYNRNEDNDTDNDAVEYVDYNRNEDSTDDSDEYDSDEYDDDLFDSDDKVTTLYYERIRMKEEHSYFILTDCSNLNTFLIGQQSFTGYEKCVIQSCFILLSPF